MTQAPNPLPQPGLPGAGGRSVGNLMCVASMFVWAAGFPAAEVLLDTWHPVALTAARMLLAVLLLLPLWIVLDGWQAVLTARWGRSSAEAADARLKGAEERAEVSVEAANAEKAVRAQQYAEKRAAEQRDQSEDAKRKFHSCSRGELTALHR